MSGLVAGAKELTNRFSDLNPIVSFKAGCTTTGYDIEDLLGTVSALYRGGDIPRGAKYRTGRKRAGSRPSARPAPLLNPPSFGRAGKAGKRGGEGREEEEEEVDVLQREIARKFERFSFFLNPCDGCPFSIIRQGPNQERVALTRPRRAWPSKNLGIQKGADCEVTEGSLRHKRKRKKTTEYIMNAK